MTNIALLCGKLPKDIPMDALQHHLESVLDNMLRDTKTVRIVLSESNHPIEGIAKYLSERLCTSQAYVIADWKVYRKSTAYVRVLKKVNIADYVIIINYDKSGNGNKTKTTRGSEDLCKKKGKPYLIIDMSFDENNETTFTNMDVE